jgi:bifunctional enzyme CysN/CysC
MAHVSELIGRDIEAYLEAHEHKSLLRFITCGSVDDGKSTLIGRLLYDSKMIFEDQLAALEADSKKVGTQGGALDFALLVDGLAAEREQGITIDVAYRFFSTDKRKFIVADTPGHEQYTRNMVTGASTADLAVILIDARKGVLTQTRRHSYIVSLLGIRHVVLAVNKMDLVDCSREIFDTIVAEYRDFARQIKLPEVVAIPVSGLRGDNIKDPSTAMPWYHGPTLMGHLESVPIEDHVTRAPFRLPVQWVNRPNLDFRGFAGTIVSGAVSPGDKVRVLPSARESRVARVVAMGGDLKRAVAGQSVTITLADEIDASRGDVFAGVDSLPGVADQFETTIIWMSDEPMLPGRPYWIKIGTKQATGNHHRAQVQGQRQHTRAPGGQDAGLERDRRLQPVARPDDRFRPVRREPRHRRLHSHRPALQRDDRRGTHPLRAAPLAEHPLAGARGQQGPRTRRSRTAAHRTVVHRPFRRRQVDDRKSRRKAAARARQAHLHAGR